MFRTRRKAFSLVEVVLAMGIAAIVLLSILALLPLGVKNNQISVEETRATSMLTTIEADLRNSHPDLNSGKSLIFGLPLPYKKDLASGRLVFNDALQPQILASGYSVHVDDSEQPVSGANGRSRYQVSVIYTQLPFAANSTNLSSLSALQARLVVNWPSANLSDPGSLTDLSRLSGYVESTISFPAP